jgi:hypothetical protein
VERSAAVVVPILCELLDPESVVDFGCGQGEWLDAFGDIERFGVDIAAPELMGYVRYDLRYSLTLGRRKYDLALCLEVGEHLPASASDVLVDTITDHADTVVFSAAVPGQEGTGHINCQPHEYWHAKFSERGYGMWDKIRPLIAHDERVSPWYRSNTFLYTRDL